MAIQAGQLAHGRVDDPRASRPLTLKSVEIAHPELGISGRCDVLRGDPATGVEIVEYKSTPVRRRAEVRPAHVVQLTLQRLCLERMGVEVLSQAIYFTNHELLQTISIGEGERDAAVDWVRQTQAVVESESAPEPLEDDPRCGSCSHAEVCLPDEYHMRRQSRSISVSNPDAEIVHLVTLGSRASLRSGRLRVVKGDDELASVPFERVLGLVVHGNIELSSALVRECLWNGLTVVWCSSRGRVIGWAHSAESPAGMTRVQQHVRSLQGDLPIAKEILAAKLANQATQLRRNAGTTDGRAAEIRSISARMRSTSSIEELYGFEGRGAALYFDGFAGMIRSAGLWACEEWPGRRGRGARDPLNVTLNFTYGLLLADCIRGLVACGLDPSAGFVHSSSRNKPALALDLMEEFRAPVADSVVVGALNNGELRRGMYSRAFGDSRLTETGRRALVGAYERRLQTEIKHPTFSYRVTWRRCIEVQARLLRGTLDGSQAKYVGMRTR